MFTKDSYYKEKFTNLQAHNETFSGIEFEDCEFNKCIFMECAFKDCRFLGCKFDKCTISANDVCDSSFLNISFQNSKAIGIDWTKAKRLESLIFKESQINYGNFRLLRLENVIVENCIARNVDFTEAKLMAGNFSRTDLSESIFLHTDLTKANFQGAKNYSIDLRLNSVKGAKFSLPEALALLSGLDVEVT